MLGISLSLTTLCLLGLARLDPKRERANRDNRPIRVLRTGLLLLCVLPGLWLAAVGDAAAFVLWTGGACVLGWLITQGVNRIAWKRWKRGS